MKKDEYIRIKNLVVKAGYLKEIMWQQSVKPCKDAITFHSETCWVILNSGMKEQIARIIWERIQNAWTSGKDISTIFKHKGKVAAIKFVTENYISLFEGYLKADDKINFLKTIPFIGNITCFHLAKNLGFDVVKPDRHLVRVAEKYSINPDQLCDKLSKETGDKKCVVDIVIWRACNLKIL